MQLPEEASASHTAWSSESGKGGKICQVWGRRSRKIWGKRPGMEVTVHIRNLWRLIGRQETVIQFMYEYSDLFHNKHLSMLPDYVFSYGIIQIWSRVLPNERLCRAWITVWFPKAPAPPFASPLFHSLTTRSTINIPHPASPSASMLIANLCTQHR